MLATLDQDVQIRLVEANAPRPPLAALQVLSDRDLPWMVEAHPADPAPITI